MIHPNAVITAYAKAEGHTGRGKPVLRAVTLTAPIPCSVSTPTFRQERRAQANNVRVELRIQAPALAFTGVGVEPKAEDRITVQRTTAAGASETVDVFAVVEVERSSYAVAGAGGSLGGAAVTSFGVVPAAVGDVEVLPAEEES